MKVIVVGAGIVGACAANFILRDGHEVVLVDPNEAGSGCSYGNAGSVSVGSCSPLSMPGMAKEIPGWLLDPLGPLHIRKAYLLKALPWLIRFVRAGEVSQIAAKADAMRALHRDAISLYSTLLHGTDGMDLLRVTGVLQAYRKNSSLDQSADWHLRGERGVRQQILDAAALRDLVPALSHEFRQGVLLPEHGFITAPQRFVQVLVQRFSDEGGKVLRARVKSLIQEQGKTVRGVVTALGEIRAQAVVICAGAWSMRLLGGTCIKIPLETQRGYHAMAIEPNIRLPMPVVASEMKVYATPMLDGLRFAGTVEFAGLDAQPDYRRAEANLMLGRAMFPTLEYTGVEEWMGHRPCLPDSLPVVGAAPGHQGLFLNFGHGHYGMTASPASGALLAALISGRTSPADPYPYRADRF